MSITSPEQLNHLLGEEWHVRKLYDGDQRLVSDKHIQFHNKEVRLYNAYSVYIALTLRI
jgi:hypothetical protein